MAPLHNLSSLNKPVIAGGPRDLRSGRMAMTDVSVVLAHGAWADGTSWARVITALKAEAVDVFAAPLPLTSLADDVAALNRSLDRTEGPIVWWDTPMRVRSSLSHTPSA